MTAVPANYAVILEFQDNRGFRATTRIVSFDADITANALTVPDLWTGIAAQAAAVAAMSNAKLVKVGFSIGADYAQEPDTETGVYELVIQKARLQGGDGNGGFMALSVPAPKDALFLTSADNNLVVVNPAAGLLTTLQSTIAGNQIGLTPRGGIPFAQFFGGQLVEGKPRRNRVLQGA